MMTLLGTSEIAKAERPRFWAKSLESLCGTVQTDCYGAKTIDGEIEYGALGRLKLCRIEATRHRVALPLEWSGSVLHPVVKVVMQMQGNSIFEQDGGSLTLAPGDGLAYDLSRPHSIVNPSLTKHLVVIVPKDLAVQHGFCPTVLGGQLFSTREGIGRLAFDLVNSTFQQLRAISCDCQDELAKTLLNLLFLPLSANGRQKFESATGKALKQQIKAYIDANLHDPDLCIDRIAAALNCSKRYLHMAFASEGTTIARYIWMVRLEQCRRDLEAARRSATTITDIAFSWGFNSSSHFSRLFKERYGVSPSRLLHQAE
jgi:AraC-like DNA-binding protein